jgi:hypothetical protein
MYDLVWIFLGEASVLETGLSLDHCAYLVEFMSQFAGQGSTLVCAVAL